MPLRTTRRGSLALAAVNAAVLLWGAAVVATADPASTPAVATPASSAAATVVPVSATPSPVPAGAAPVRRPTPKPPPVVLVAIRHPKPNSDVHALGPAHVLAVDARGRGKARPLAPPVPVQQVSSAARRIVTTKVLTNDMQLTDCHGVSGCNMFTTTEQGLAISHLDGSNERVITRGGFDSAPAFSPNGRRIAFLSNRERRPDGAQSVVLALINPDGRNERILAGGAGDTHSYPTWAPTGRYIATVRNRITRDTRTGLYAESNRIVLTPTGQGATRELAEGYWRDLSWSHDGRSLVAVQARQGRDYAGNVSQSGEEVWVIPTDGGPARQVTHVSPATSPFVQHCGNNGGSIQRINTPMWSPDDRSIAFLSSHRHTREFDRVFDVFVVSAAGGRAQLLRPTARAVCGPRYSTEQIEPEDVTLLGWI